MVNLRVTLPPPNSLVVFEAASRHLNFTRAAEELRVTQAAVSRQIQVLEAHLGVPLFHRLHRALQLTRDGERLQQAVSTGLGHIASTAADHADRDAGQHGQPMVRAKDRRLLPLHPMSPPRSPACRTP